MAGQGGVPVGSEALHAGRHGHCDGDARVEEAGGESCLSEAGAASYADFRPVDFGSGEDEGVKHAVEAPSPGCEDAFPLRQPLTLGILGEGGIRKETERG